MSFKGPEINKLNGGLGGGETSDRVAVFVTGADALNTLEQYKAHELLQIEDLEARGITEKTDETNKELIHYHLSEVFRLSPETSVYIITVPKLTKVSELKNDADFIAALRSIERINTIAIAGLIDDDTAAIAVQGAQLLVDKLAEDFVYIDTVLVEGKGGYIPETLVADFADLRALESETVTPIWAQDPAIAGKDAAYADHAAVGSALGMLLIRAIHENLGSVDIEVKPGKRKSEESYTLSDTKLGLWLSAALSNRRTFETLSGADQQKLDSLGYVYVGKFEGYAGYFFSNSHTCTEESSDYCFIERNAIWNKAARIVRTTLIPRIRGKVQADPSTGYIKNTTITDWDGRVRKNLLTMKNESNIADFDIYINPKQPAVSTKPFNIKLSLVADGIVHEFEVDLGYTRSI
jgi:hypothetical protein